MNHRVSNWLALASAASNVALGIALWGTGAKGHAFLIVAMGFVPFAAVALWISHRRNKTNADHGGPNPAAELALAGWFLSAAMALVLASHMGVMKEATSDRLSHATMGLLLLLAGNRVPKLLTPLHTMRCSPARTQSIQRFTGWVFVLAGMFVIAAALFAPPQTGKVIFGVAMISAVALIGLFKLLTAYTARPATDTTGAA